MGEIHHTCSFDGAAFGERLGAMRVEMGVTQEQLATWVGCTRPHIANLESGRFVPSFLLFVAICDVLDVGADWMIWGDDDAEEAPDAP